MEDLGMHIYCTQGTYEYLKAHDVACQKVNRISEGSPSVLDLIEIGMFDMVINTPAKDRKHNKDGFTIRRSATERSIPVITAIDTARAVIQARVKGRSNELKAVDVTKIGRR
jgi:carbamoyl-phosphate synthase large subunit